MDISFLLGGSVLAVLLVQILKDVLGKVSNRYGALISQITLLIVAFGIAGVGVLLQLLPPDVLTATGTIFVSAMACYEVLYKSIYQQVIKGQ